MTKKSRTRTGLSVVWALIVLTVCSSLIAIGFGQIYSSRKETDLIFNKSQADWLAHAGLDIAITKIAAKSADYVGETLQLLPQGEVRIRVSKMPDDEKIVQIEVTAAYPKGEKSCCTSTMTHSIPRVKE